MRPPVPALKCGGVFQVFCKSVQRITVSLLLISIWPAFSSAQTTPKRALITQPIEASKLTILRGNTYPLALPQYDRGAAPASLPMARMLLVLKRSPELETALDALLDQQQDKSSPNYHAWLTPQQFGQQFGPADQDIQAITSWLQLQGFQIAKVSNGRTVIEFSGTAAQVQSAFHTEIHKYTVNGVDHWANASDPQIPTALAAAVAGIDTLHNFPRHAMHHLGRAYTRSKETGAAKPVSAGSGPATMFTLPAPNGCGVQFANCFALGPYDFGTIYDVLPLWNASPTHIDGTGQTIAIVAESNIVLQDVTSFRTYFGLANPPKLNVILDGPDPGLDPGGAETEADLDVEWAGAIAPNATIDLVVSQPTESTLGADLSAVYVVDNNLAPVLNVSFGICELSLGTAGNQFFNQLWQQAAAQGITVLVSTGDSGAAVCDRGDGEPPAPAVFGLTVSGFSTTPYNVAVGGTDFNDLTNASTFWSLTNTAPASNPSAPPTLSAKSYIPETTWNNTCTNSVFGNLLGFSPSAETNCNNPQLVNFVTSVGGSGGQSNCITSDGQNESTCAGGYPIPSWQTGTGVPTKGGRAVPDVSLFASVESPSGSFYIICEADLLPPGITSCDLTDPATEFLEIGGTSASAPTFSAIMSLVNQKTNSAQGNANYVLYKLAAQQPTAFHDVLAGSTIAMPCANGSPDCIVTNKSDAYGVLSGFSTATGYDLATGLGSVDANTLVTKWNTVATKSSATTLNLTPSPVTIKHGQPVTVNIGVAAVAPATGTPTGNVSLIANTVPPGSAPEVTQQGVEGFALSNGAVTSTTNVLPGGKYSVVAQYPGDGTFTPSTSAPTSVTVTPEASTAQIAYELFNPATGIETNPNATMATFGAAPALLRINVTSQSGDTCVNNAPSSSGCPTGSVTVTDNGKPLDAGTFPLNSNGYAEDQVIDLSGGVHNLKATYSGDNSFSAPAAATDTVTINPVTTTNTLTASPSQIQFGLTVTLTASISAQNIFSSIGPTGTVTFFSGTTSVGSVPVSGSVNSSQVNIIATLFIANLPIGQDSITAHYSGDSSYAASISTPIAVSVLYPTITTVTSSAPTIQAGQSVTFTAKVAPSKPGGPALTGAVQFVVNGGNVGNLVTLQNGQAQFTTSSLAWGSTIIGANYFGDANYAPSNGIVAETINPFTTTTSVTTSTTPIEQGQSATFTATVAPASSGAPALPTGNVIFAVNGLGMGGQVSINSSGQATLTTSALTVGSLTVNAKYLGDNLYSGSSGNFSGTVIAAPDFSIAANPSTITVTKPGQSGSTMLTLTAINGLTGTFNLVPQCSAFPSESSCAVSPASVTFSSTVTTASVMLTASTTAPSSVPAQKRVQPPTTRTGLTVVIGLMAMIAALAYFLRKVRKLGFEFALSVIAFAALLTIAACGGGGGGGGGGGVTNPGTPIGSDPNATVSFTLGSATHTLPLTINVQ